MDADTKDLVRRSRAGDTAAFETLFRSYQRPVYRLALYLVSDSALAEDLTQETFIRAWERLDRLREETAFGGWLRTIAMNLARDWLRSRQGQRPPEELSERQASADPGPDEEVGCAEVAVAVRQAVATLPEHQRLIVAMHHLEEMEVDTIAAALSLPKGTVLSRLSRGREMLRKKLRGRVAPEAW